MKPLVTICVPVFNHENFVKECINSIFCQDYSELELIIIDDCSTDKSYDKVMGEVFQIKNRFSRIEIRRHHSNVGLCRTLNECLEWASGKYFSCIASDDILYPYKISHQVNYLLNNENVGGVFGAMTIINWKGAVIGRPKARSRIYCFEDILLGNYYLPAPTALIRTELIRESGGYDPSLSIEDWPMWLKITRSGKYTLATLDIEYAFYRRHGNNLSSNHQILDAVRKIILNEYKDHPLYGKAIENISLKSAIDNCYENKIIAFKHFSKSGIFSPGIGHLKFLLKVLIPKWMGRRVSRHYR